MPYQQALEEVYESECDWIRFNNFNYWYTRADDPSLQSGPARIRHYSIFPDCAPRIRSWRTCSTNIRIFNHNAPEGKPWPGRFNLRHYPMRSETQALARLENDRAGLRRGGSNFHYDNMAHWRERLVVEPQELHFDDGISELNLEPKFDWRTHLRVCSSAGGSPTF